MFNIYEPFEVTLSNINDIELDDEEYDIIVKDFMPLVEAKGKPMATLDPATISKLSKAVENRNYISIYYRHSNGSIGSRLVEPYCIGRGYKYNGEVTNTHYYLRAFVIMDSKKDKTVTSKITRRVSVSVSDKEKRWRLFRVDRMERFVNLNKKFGKYRRQYNPNDKNIGTILSSLEFNQFPFGENPKINY